MILIAGGTGMLGSRVAGMLLKRGDAVRVMTREPGSERAQSLGEAGAEVVEGDLCVSATLPPALAGVERLVISVQAMAGPGSTPENNPRTCDYAGVQELLNASKAAGVRHVVYVSIAGASPDAVPEFVRIKHETEGAVRDSGMTWTIVRPAAFMEFWAQMIGGPVLTGGTAMVFGDGDNPVNFVSADDVAEFVVLALTDPALQGQTITVGGPDNMTLNEVVALFEREAGHSAKVRKMPVGALKTMSGLMAPFNPALGRQMGMGVFMATTDQTVDMTELSARYPVELTHLPDIAHEMVEGAQAH